MVASFTLGPWAVEAMDGGFFLIVSADTDVAKAWHNTNAHLIAAAPDLYAALYAMVRTRDAAAVKAAKEALAKARGEP